MCTANTRNSRRAFSMFTAIALIVGAAFRYQLSQAGVFKSPIPSLPPAAVKARMLSTIDLATKAQSENTRPGRSYRILPTRKLRASGRARLLPSARQPLPHQSAAES